ncbi:MAG TPA: DegT/DnrJ/EryC1/StrS family aminotransferase [Chloroflexaceae bacterium]|nr:DegT/DnrJ/EryC1/StrS family aminotransferase [Chloroflexaceae bacterium]
MAAPTTPFRVPRARLPELHRAMGEELRAAIEPLLFGPPSEGYAARARLEAALAEATGLPHVCAVHSGTIALLIALRACGVGPGHEVITVGNSDISTTAAVRQAGATPVLCDVRPEDYTLDVALVEELVTPRTAAIVPVDLYGHPADVAALRPLADRHGLRIVEDAALALGAADHGRPVGAFADATVFSFAPYKPLGSLGNGAALATADPAVAARARLLCGYGHDPAAEPASPLGQRYIAEGYNVPLDPFQAALLLVKLPRLAAWSEGRRAVAGAYAAALGGLVGLPSFRPESRPTFRAYTVRVPDAEIVCAALRAAGVEAVRHYAPPIAEHPVYGGGLPGSDRLPVTAELARSLVCLPVAPELTAEDVAYVAARLEASGPPR